ncbi:hypothetical protein VTO73DRAFT_6193 [Trametes versicolor]
MQIGALQAAFCSAILRRKSTDALAKCGKATPGGTLDLTPMGTSSSSSDMAPLIDESACGALRFRVPPSVYSNRLSEAISGDVIKKLNLPREESVNLTKASLSIIMTIVVWDKHGLNPAAAESVIHQKGLNRQQIFDSVKASSKRLQLEHIDVLQCHRTEASADYAITHNLTPLVSIQNDHSPMYRKEEREMFPTLTMHGVGSIPWSPLARGLLSRPNAASSKRSDTDPLAQAGMVYGITPDISGFAFPAAEELVGHCVLASHRASVDIRGSAKITPLCAMRAPDLELARRSQDQHTPRSSELRSYALLTHAACSTGRFRPFIALTNLPQNAPVVDEGLP